MTREEAKQALAERRPMLLAVAVRIVRANSIPPDDVVQEAYLRALRAVEEGKFPAERDHLFAWFTRIVYNAAYDALRGHARRKGRAAALDSDPADPSPGPLDSLIEREDAATVERGRALLPRLLGELPGEARKAVELRFQGLTNRQIAAALGMPAGSISALFRSACQQLRRRLAGRPG